MEAKESETTNRGTIVFQHAGLQSVLFLFSIHFRHIEKDTKDKCDQRLLKWWLPQALESALRQLDFWIWKFKLGNQQLMVKIANITYRNTCS